MISAIRTTRLTLRPLESADAVVLHRIYQSKGILRYFPIITPPHLDKVLRFVISQQEHWDKYGYGNWGILLDGETRIVGWAGLQYVPEVEETEVGFLLDRSFWGNGFATEAARASLQFGFERCSLDHMIALVHLENAASRRVTEKCGMTYADTVYLWGIDLMRHRIDKSQWNTLSKEWLQANVR